MRSRHAFGSSPPGGVSVVVVVSSRVTKLKREQEWLVLIEYP